MGRSRARAVTFVVLAPLLLGSCASLATFAATQALALRSDLSAADRAAIERDVRRELRMRAVATGAELGHSYPLPSAADPAFARAMTVVLPFAATPDVPILNVMARAVAAGGRAGMPGGVVRLALDH